jgi:hypothetical protein
VNHFLKKCKRISCIKPRYFHKEDCWTGGVGQAEFSAQEMSSPRWLTLLVVVAWLAGESAHRERFLAPVNTAKTRVSCALMRVTRACGCNVGVPCFVGDFARA